MNEQILPVKYICTYISSYRPIYCLSEPIVPMIYSDFFVCLLVIFICEQNTYFHRNIFFFLCWHLKNSLQNKIRYVIYAYIFSPELATLEDLSSMPFLRAWIYPDSGFYRITIRVDPVGLVWRSSARAVVFADCL